MIIGEHVETRPAQLHLYARGTQGTGAIPGAGATFTVPIPISSTLLTGDLLNPADNTTRLEGTIGAQTHAPKRKIGIWFIDIFLFQDGPATLQLKERPPDQLTQAVLGLTDTTRAVWTRPVRASITYRTTWRLCGSECKIIYTNGASALTIFAFDVIARSI